VCARAACARRACRDAIGCIEQALQILPDLKPDAELAGHELQLRRFYAMVLSETRGYSSDAVEDNLTRALMLAQDTGDARARFDVVYALLLLHLDRADLKTAADMCQQVLDSASDAPTRARTEYVSGATALWCGDLRKAEKFLKRASSCSSSIEDGMRWAGADPALGAASHDSLRLWVAGFPEKARTQQQDVIARAEHLGHPFTSAYVLGFASLLLVLSDMWTEAERLASCLLDVSSEHGFPRWIATALVCSGCAKVQRDDAESGIDQIRTGLQTLRDASMHLGESLMLSLYANACLSLREWKAGLQATQDGREHCRRTGERLFEPELWRLEGEMLLVRGRAEGLSSRMAAVYRDQAASCFTLARSHAQSKGAHELERRARRRVTPGSSPRGSSGSRLATG